MAVKLTDLKDAGALDHAFTFKIDYDGTMRHVLRDGQYKISSSIEGKELKQDIPSGIYLLAGNMNQSGIGFHDEADLNVKDIYPDSTRVYLIGGDQENKMNRSSLGILSAYTVLNTFHVADRTLENNLVLFTPQMQAIYASVGIKELFVVHEKALDRVFNYNSK